MKSSVKEDKILMCAIIDQIPDENINQHIIFEDKIVLIFNAYLLKLLTAEKLRATVLDTNEHITINGTEYQKDYVKGYFEGKEYFDSKFPKDEFFRNPKSYIEDLYHNYNNAKMPLSVIVKGWKTAKENGPITYFNHIMIEKSAFKAGIISKVEELKEIRPSLFKDFDNAFPTIVKKQLTFDALFKDKDKAKLVKDIFEFKGYTINGQWIGLTNNKSELLTAFDVLKPLLNPGDLTPQAIIFYNEFGLKVAPKKEGGYITDRQLRNKPSLTSSRGEFEIIFSRLLQPKK